MSIQKPYMNDEVMSLNEKIAGLLNNKVPVSDEGFQQLRELIFKALELDNTHPVTLTNFGAYLCDTGNYLQALKHLRKAESSNDHSDYNLYFNIGVALMNISADKRKEAPVYFKKAKLYERCKYTAQAHIDFMAY